MLLYIHQWLVSCPGHSLTSHYITFIISSLFAGSQIPMSGIPYKDQYIINLISFSGDWSGLLARAPRFREPVWFCGMRNNHELEY